MQLQISKTDISMVSSSSVVSGQLSRTSINSTVYLPPPTSSNRHQGVSSATVLEDYKESVVRGTLDHMDKEQIERFKSLMEEGKAESERPLLKEKTEKLESLMEDEDIEKFKRHVIECRKYLMSKYFSDNTIFGGNIFDVKTTKDGETTKMSSFPGYQSYANPASFPGSQSYANPPSFSGSQSYAYPAIFNVAINKKPNSTSETPSDVGKGKQPSKKN